MVDQAFALQPLTDAGLGEQIDRSLFEQTRAHALLAILPAARFDHDGLNSLEMQEVRQNQSRGPRSYDSDLRAHREGEGFKWPGSPKANLRELGSSGTAHYLAARRQAQSERRAIS